MFNVSPIPIYEDNYVWLIELNDCCWVVDPGDHQPVIDAVTKTNKPLAGILVTHRHWDHITGIKPLLDHYSTKNTSAADILIYKPASLDLDCPATSVSEGDLINLDATTTAAVFEIPGHTKDHIAFYFEQHSSIFSGDTLFACGCGRLFDGTMLELYQALQRLKSLPQNTIIYCTHEYTLANITFALEVEPNNPDLINRQKQCTNLRKQNLPTLPTSIYQECLTNPFLRTGEQSVQKAISQEVCLSITDEYLTFKELRMWKNRY